MKICPLIGQWLGMGISCQGDQISFSGNVPGCVHGELLREGKIVEPFWHYNAENYQRIEK